MSTIYVIHHKGRGRFILVDSAKTSAEEFEVLQEAFAIEARGGQPPDGDHDKYAQMLPIHPECWAASLPYHWELAGPDGGSYVIFTSTETDQTQVNEAKAQIRLEHDVVRLRELRLEMI